MGRPAAVCKRAAAIAVLMLAGCDPERPPRSLAPPGSSTSLGAVPSASLIEGAWRATRYESLSLPLHHELGMLAHWVMLMRFEGRGDVVTVHLDGSRRVEARLSPEGGATRLVVQDPSMHLLDGVITRTPGGTLQLRMADALVSLSPDTAPWLPRLCVDANERAVTRRERCEPGEREQRAR